MVKKLNFMTKLRTAGWNVTRPPKNRGGVARDAAPQWLPQRQARGSLHRCVHGKRGAAGLGDYCGAIGLRAAPPMPGPPGAVAAGRGGS
jgi:hypothetical protein